MICNNLNLTNKWESIENDFENIRCFQLLRFRNIATDETDSVTIQNYEILLHFCTNLQPSVYDMHWMIAKIWKLWPHFQLLQTVPFPFNRSKVHYGAAVPVLGMAASMLLYRRKPRKNNFLQGLCSLAMWSSGSAQKVKKN